MSKITNLKYYHLIYVDIETTGLIQRGNNGNTFPAIIEIGALDSLSNDKFQFYINPKNVKIHSQA